MKTPKSSVSLFRERLANENLKRFEIYASDVTRKDIRDIATQEGITSGVAAEALLKLGIERYREDLSGALKSAAITGSVECNPMTFSASRSASVTHHFASNNQEALTAQSAMAVCSEDKSKIFPKKLAQYTDRSELRSSTRTTDETRTTQGSNTNKMVSVTQNLIAAAKQRHIKS